MLTGPEYLKPWLPAAGLSQLTLSSTLYTWCTTQTGLANERRQDYQTKAVVDRLKQHEQDSTAPNNCLRETQEALYSRTGTMHP